MKSKIISRLLAGCLAVTLITPSAAFAASPTQTISQGESISASDLAQANDVVSDQEQTDGEELQGKQNYAGNLDSGKDAGSETVDEGTVDEGARTGEEQTLTGGEQSLAADAQEDPAEDNTSAESSASVDTEAQDGDPAAQSQVKTPAGWKKDGERWTYYEEDGSVPKEKFVKVDGEWYYFDKDGWMVTGWHKIENKWYYFHSSGRRMTGWQWVGSKCYYMDEDGVMAADTWIGTYYVDASGAWIPGKVKVEAGWVKSGSRWWYRHSDGSYTKSDWELINGKWYYFDASGWMVTGWKLVNNKWYYMSGSGAMVTGWQKLGKVWYYLTGSGAMATGWQKINGAWYYLDTSGAMLTGWQKINRTWYCMNGSGAMVTGWQKIGGIWYYLDESGAMATGWRQIGGSWYYMNGSGAMLTGWQKIGGDWYYLDESGKMAADTWIGSYYVNASGVWVQGKTTKGGWVQSGGRWYYDNGDGTCPKSTWKSIDGKEYYFDKDGWMVTGWLKIGSIWYYLKSDGTKAYDYWVGKTGVGGYYISKYGRMVADTTYSYGSYIYTFDANGLCTGSEDRYVKVTDPKNGKTYTVEKQYQTDPRVGVDVTEDEFLAAAVYAEAGNQGMPGMTGVALVMLNRMYSGSYPASADVMIYQKQQFEVARNGSLTRYLKDINNSLLANAKEAVARARNIMNAYQTSGTPRTVDGLTMPEGKTDFNYMGFMTPAAFEEAGLDWEKTEAFTYLNTTFYTTWIKK